VAGIETAVLLRIARGDDLNARDVNGMTPLMLSAMGNKPTICRLLLAAGADHRLLDSTGRIAYEIAVGAGASETSAVLDAYTATLGIQTKDDRVSRFRLIPEAKGMQVEADVEWEPESESAPPETDPSVLASAHAIQREITAHKLINDPSIARENIERHPLPQVRIDDAEVRDQLRQLVLRAIHGGHVSNVGEKELNAFLDEIVNDLGVKAVLQRLGKC